MPSTLTVLHNDGVTEVLKPFKDANGRWVSVWVSGKEWRGSELGWYDAAANRAAKA